MYMVGTKGEIVWAIQGCGERILSNDLGKTKIAQLDGQLLVCHENILRLNIPVNDSSVMLNFGVSAQSKWCRQSGDGR